MKWRFNWGRLWILVALGGIGLLRDESVSARLAGGAVLFLLVAAIVIRRRASAEMSRVRLQVWVDRPQEITGVTTRRNRLRQERLWTELTRIGATEEQNPNEGVVVAGEAAIGAYLGWSSSGFRLGIPSGRGRVFAFSGTGHHELDSWSDLPDVAFALLEEVATGAGPDGLWRVLAEDSGYNSLLEPAVLHSADRRLGQDSGIAPEQGAASPDSPG